MKIEIVKVCSGHACGKQMMRVTNNKGEIIGWIQPTNIDMEAVLGGTMVFIAKQCHSPWKFKAATTLFDAFHFLGISTKELDKVGLPAGCYTEFWTKY